MNINIKKHISVMLACMMIMTGAMPATVFAADPPVDSGTVEGDV